MTQNSIRNEFHSDLAALISNEIQYKHANYYYFLGKVDSWGSVDTPPTTVQTDSEFENNFYQYTAKSLQSKEISMDTYMGKVVLVVLKDLEKLLNR